jgi:NTP pyrophosphatase (non-canonical NTP hydrolase)
MTMEQPTPPAPLHALQAAADEWIRDTGKGYFDPLTNMAMLAEETGEVARILARRYGQQVSKPGDGEHDLGEELCDVLFVLLCLANQTGLDLQAAWVARMEKKTKRDAHRFTAR